MAIYMISALEIFSNPNDLEIFIGQEKNGAARFSIGISRGPSHDFKPILTSQPVIESKEEAIDWIKTILQAIHKVVTDELCNPKSCVAQYLNPGNFKIDQSSILNNELIDRILYELRKQRVASTYKMLIPLG